MSILLHVGILSNAADSLFTYLPYTSFSYLRDNKFAPVFTVDHDNTTADISICSGDESCIFDVIATNDSSIGIATLAAVGQIEDTVQMSYPGKLSLSLSLSLSHSHSLTLTHSLSLSLFLSLSLSLSLSKCASICIILGICVCTYICRCVYESANFSTVYCMRERHTPGYGVVVAIVTNFYA